MFVAKCRHRVFREVRLVRLDVILRDVCADFEVELVEFNGGGDDVHLLVRFPPKVSLAKLMNSLRGVSSRRLRQECPNHMQHYWRAQKLWSVSFFAGSVGDAPLDTVTKYIESQNRPSRQKRFIFAAKDGALSPNR